MFDFTEIGYETFSEFFIIKTFTVKICDYLGFCFLKLVLKTETTILRKSDSAVSTVSAFKNLSRLSVSSRSMREGFSGFLKQVGLFTKLCNSFHSLNGLYDNALTHYFRI